MGWMLGYWSRVTGFERQMNWMRHEVEAKMERCWMRMGDLVELKSAWWRQMGVLHSGLIEMWHVPRIA